MSYSLFSSSSFFTSFFSCFPCSIGHPFGLTKPRALSDVHQCRRHHLDPSWLSSDPRECPLSPIMMPSSLSTSQDLLIIIYTVGWAEVGCSTVRLDPRGVRTCAPLETLGDGGGAFKLVHMHLKTAIGLGAAYADSEAHADNCVGSAWWSGRSAMA
jgi:hypothetical protein